MKAAAQTSQVIRVDADVKEALDVRRVEAGDRNYSSTIRRLLAEANR